MSETREKYPDATLDLAQSLMDAVNDFGRSCVQKPVEDQEDDAELWADILAIAIVNSPNLQGFINRVESKGARTAALVAVGFGYRAGMRAATIGPKTAMKTATKGNPQNRWLASCLILKGYGCGSRI